ncbi:alpha-latrocrustotoxin-Lt1a-like [Physella acuta]|uniref:alpha-latrocrustotoxin-Lt1a-like n=1 Tax=Physella acuta TaxID=109671 RepID=UPI0027DDE9B2|nr:alpha-latrocrustotoxin-Lt1a-like [Physella acuta]
MSNSGLQRKTVLINQRIEAMLEEQKHLKAKVTDHVMQVEGRSREWISKGDNSVEGFLDICTSLDTSTALLIQKSEGFSETETASLENDQLQFATRTSGLMTGSHVKAHQQKDPNLSSVDSIRLSDVETVVQSVQSDLNKLQKIFYKQIADIKAETEKVTKKQDRKLKDINKKLEILFENGEKSDENVSKLSKSIKEYEENKEEIRKIIQSEQDKLDKLSQDVKMQTDEIFNIDAKTKINTNLMCTLIQQRLAPVEKVMQVFNQSSQNRELNRAKLDVIEKDLMKITTDLLTLKQKPLRQSTLGFIALRGRDGRNDKLKFKYVSLNTEGVFNPARGEFTAPINGLYVASITLKQQNNGIAWLGVVHKSNNKAKCLGVVGTERPGESSSKTFVVWMAKGDVLYSFKRKFCDDEWQYVFGIITSQNIDVNVKNKIGQTPLTKACLRFNVEAVEFLLKNGANVFLSDESGNTTLHRTVKHEQDIIELVVMLVSNGDYMCVQKDDVFVGETQWANTNFFSSDVEKQNVTELLSKATETPRKCLVNMKNKDEINALHIACSLGHINIVKFLLKENCDCNVVSNKSGTALMIALQHNKLTVADILLENKADINIHNRNGDTALHVAVRYSLTEAVRQLVLSGAKVNAQNRTGNTPLFAATNYQVSKFLIDKNSNVNLRNNNGETTLHHCAGDSLTCLFIESDAELDVASSKGHTPLMYAVDVGDVPKIKWLVEHGANVNVQDCDGRNAFMHAVVRERNTVYTYIRLEMCQYLAENGSDVNVKDVDGQTACKLSIRGELAAAVQEPWPLVKLAFIEVSTLLGTGPMREEKLKQTKLPPRLQRTLMFQEPISRLPVEDWSKIPLCFDPVQYETLPCPRPLLYYWPVGHRLVN